MSQIALPSHEQNLVWIDLEMTGLLPDSDRIIEIADDADIDPHHKRIMVDARKWVAAKLKSRKYGDKVTQEHSGPNGGPIRAEVTRVERVVVDANS
jgi:oligoribonuclease (3'-5' exoribonuclease)